MVNGSIQVKQKRRGNGFIRELGKNRVLYGLLLVPIVILIVFRYIPMVGVQIAFRDYKPLLGIWESPWVGLKYIRKFLGSAMFSRVMVNTLAINLYSLATFPLSLLFALMLNYLPSRKYRRSIQMVSYAPHFISNVVMCGMILQFLSARSGLINEVAGLFGIPAVNYMGKPEYFYSIYVWSGVWQGLGYSAVVYIAALSSVSVELHESAIVDGASLLRRIWHIDIPGVFPTFCVLLVLRCGSLLNIGFEKVLLLQNGLNASVSEVISTYTYKVAMQNVVPQYSYSAAIGIFTSVINMALLWIVNTLVKRIDNGGGLW